jgi:2,4-dienoyl-CoA reductase (NADPH2)
MGLNRWLGCIENPRTGREAAVASLAAPVRRPAPARRRILVAGAGPAGLQSAIAAARRGHEVVVHEASREAGGQLRWAASVPNRAEIGDLVRNQLSELERLHVKVLFDHPVDLDLVRSHGPDAVVVATGSVPQRPYWAAEGDPRIVDQLDVLTGAAETPSGIRVVIVDELGFHQATSVAEVLADRGCRVEILTPGLVVAQDLGITLDQEHFRMRAAAKGIVLTPESVVMGWDGRALNVLRHTSGAMREVEADLVVLAVPNRPAEGLYQELRTAGVTAHRVGDCLAPRRAHAAVIDGDRIGAVL